MELPQVLADLVGHDPAGGEAHRRRHQAPPPVPSASMTHQSSCGQSAGRLDRVPAEVGQPFGIDRGHRYDRRRAPSSRRPGVGAWELACAGARPIDRAALRRPAGSVRPRRTPPPRRGGAPAARPSPEVPLDAVVELDPLRRVERTETHAEATGVTVEGQMERREREHEPASAGHGHATGSRSPPGRHRPGCGRAPRRRRSSHISTVSSSPGNTGDEKRPSIEVNRAASESHSAWSSARPVNP